MPAVVLKKGDRVEFDTSRRGMTKTRQGVMLEDSRAVGHIQVEVPAEGRKKAKTFRPWVQNIRRV